MKIISMNKNRKRGKKDHSILMELIIPQTVADGTPLTAIQSNTCKGTRCPNQKNNQNVKDYCACLTHNHAMKAINILIKMMINIEEYFAYLTQPLAKKIRNQSSSQSIHHQGWVQMASGTVLMVPSSFLTVRQR